MAKRKRIHNPTNSFRRQLPEQFREELLDQRVGVVNISMGTGEISCQFRRQILFLYTHHQVLKPSKKRNLANQQYNTRLSRWLDRLRHFVILAGKELALTDYLTRHPTEETTIEELTKKNM